MPPKAARPPCGNPLYLQWIGEWMEQARAHNSKGYYIYKKAYDSVLRCPLSFQHPSEAEQLNGIGPGIIARLEKKFIEHYEALDQPVPRRPTAYQKRKTREAAAVFAAENPDPPPKKLKRNAKIYIPQYRTGAYAILLALLAEHNRRPADEIAYLTKADIIRLAQPHCDASFDMPDAGSSYTAWNSMKTLLEKDYVYKNGSPARYILTETGLAVARPLAEVKNDTGTKAGNLEKGIATLRRTISNQAEQGDGNEEEDYNDGLKEMRGNTIGRYQGPAAGGNYSSSRSATHTYSPPSSYTAIRNPKEPVVSASLCHDEESRDIFQYSYLTTENTRVRRREEAGVQINESTFTISYKVQFPRAQAAHSIADHIHVDGSLDGFLTGYLDEAHSQDVSPGLPTDPLAKAGSSTTRLKNGDIGTTQHLQRLPSSSLPDITSKSSSSLNNLGIVPASSTLPCTDSVTTFSTPTFPSITPIVFQPGTFEIVLILDTREIRQKKDRDYIQARLLERGVKVIVRSLELGDVIWVAKRKDEEELVLEHVLERKRADDLVASIKDGRFKEQKFRLSNSGASQIIYVIEEYNFEEAKQFGLQAIQTAMSSIQVVDGFFLKRTSTIDETINYLVELHALLKKSYESQTLHGIPDKYIDRTTFLALKRHLSTIQPDHAPHLITYQSFGELNSKSGTLTLNDLFVKMLMTVRGVSAEKASEITKRYGTPHGLFTAYDALKEEDKRKRMVKEATEGSVARRKIGQTLSEKVWQVWFAEEY